MSNKSFFISLILFLITISLVVVISRRGVPVVVKTNLENLPMEIDGYNAIESYLPDPIHKELNPDRYLSRQYRGNNGKQVDLYIGYYGTAKGGRSGHNPYSCLPGAGWGLIDAREVKLRNKNYPNGVEVNYILARKGDGCVIMLHWYQSAGNRVIATGIEQNIRRFLGRIFYKRDDGAFMQVSVFSGERGIEESNSLAKYFAERILDLVPQYWPVEE